MKRLWTNIGKVVKGQPYEVGWGGEEEDIFFREEGLQKAGNYFEIILPQAMPVLEKKGHKQRWGKNHMNRNSDCGEWPLVLRQTSAL